LGQWDGKPVKQHQKQEMHPNHLSPCQVLRHEVEVPEKWVRVAAMEVGIIGGGGMSMVKVVCFLESVIVETGIHPCGDPAEPAVGRGVAGNNQSMHRLVSRHKHAAAQEGGQDNPCSVTDKGAGGWMGTVKPEGEGEYPSQKQRRSHH